MAMKIIGLAGTAGSGKDTVAELLCEIFDMHSFNMGDYVRAITRFVFDLPQDSSPVRDQLFEVANTLRSVHQASIVEMGIVQAKERGFDIQLIAGLRSVGEADAIRSAGGIVIGVDADPKLRYERIKSRARDAESERAYEEFLKQDEHENKGIGEGQSRGIRTIVDSADIVIKNENSLKELKEQIQALTF